MIRFSGVKKPKKGLSLLEKYMLRRQGRIDIVSGWSLFKYSNRIIAMPFEDYDTAAVSVPPTTTPPLASTPYATPLVLDSVGKFNPDKLYVSQFMLSDIGQLAYDMNKMLSRITVILDCDENGRAISGCTKNKKCRIVSCRKLKSSYTDMIEKINTEVEILCSRLAECENDISNVKNTFQTKFKEVSAYEHRKRILEREQNAACKAIIDECHVRYKRITILLSLKKEIVSRVKTGFLELYLQYYTLRLQYYYRFALKQWNKLKTLKSKETNTDYKILLEKYNLPSIMVTEQKLRTLNFASQASLEGELKNIEKTATDAKDLLSKCKIT